MAGHGKIEKLLDKARETLRREPRLIELDKGRVVFVGDTHGDFEATVEVVRRYFQPGCTLVFLGDYVDRGPASLQNVNFLLEHKIAHPDCFYLLMGNHEGYAVESFHPADFWESLDAELRRQYAEVLRLLPLVVSASNGLVALHGVLPRVPALRDVNRIELGSEEWHQITWGDWREEKGGFLGIDSYTGRPQFGEGWFEQVMSCWGKRVLVRSHQPDAPPVIYNRRCLTIFTSSAYRHYIAERTIAWVDLEKEVWSTDDVHLERV